METMQLIQQLAPTPVIVMLLALPWLAVAAMHAISAKVRVALDDKWNLRAAAALRWTAPAGYPDRPVGNAVFMVPARRAGLANAGSLYLAERQAA